MIEQAKRICWNCCAYEKGECGNGLGDVSPGCSCDVHKSRAEDRKETVAINRFRAVIGLPSLNLA
jgi:hypothetical protein